VAHPPAPGAAGLAGLAAGFSERREQLAQLRETDRRFEPRLAPAVRERLYAGWKRAVAATLAYADLG
jgi:glycerol kinase